MKTVHGAEFYANKKHKGTPNDGSEDGGNGGLDSSPRSEDMHSGKTTSLSSPSIKSESDANSPGQPMINSPLGVSQLANGMHEDYDCVPSVSSVQYGGSVSAIDDPAWPYEDEDVEVWQFIFGFWYEDLLKIYFLHLLIKGRRSASRLT